MKGGRYRQCRNNNLKGKLRLLILKKKQKKQVEKTVLINFCQKMKY